VRSLRQFTDRIGLKPLLVASGCCMVAEMAILCIAPRDGGLVLFLICLANLLLSGLAEGLASGAYEAIVYYMKSGLFSRS
jgi:hypothetical protein